MEPASALSTGIIVLMRMTIVALVGALSLALGVFIVGGELFRVNMSMDGVRRGVFLILMSAIIIALGRIYEVLVEIRDK